MLSQPTHITIYEAIIPIINGQIFINKTLLYNFYQMFINVVRFKMIMMVNEEYVLWGVTPFSRVQEYWSFRWMCCLQSQEIWVKVYSTTQLEATCYSNALVNLYQTIWYHISQASILGTCLLNKIWKHYGTNEQQNGTELP